jgi:REP element-mobilizing transposase RayT
MAVRLYVHVTWHTWRRQPMVRSADVPVIVRALHSAAARTRCRVAAHAVLSEHVHVLLRVGADASLSAFMREAKSESARRVNECQGAQALRWCRGYFGDSVSPNRARFVIAYLARQHARHPDRVPA